MELNEAVERLKKILLQRDEINKIEDKEEREIEKSAYFEEMPFEAIDTVLEELNNRIPRKHIEKYYKDTRKQRRKEYLHKYYVEKIKPKRKRNKE